MNGPIDSRGWMAIGLFALAFYLFTLIAFLPQLQTNELFKLLATAVISGSFCGGVVAFYFNTAKGSADKDVTISELSKKQP